MSSGPEPRRPRVPGESSLSYVEYLEQHAELSTIRRKREQELIDIRRQNVLARQKPQDSASLARGLDFVSQLFLRHIQAQESPPLTLGDWIVFGVILGGVAPLLAFMGPMIGDWIQSLF